jgi:hypothetical protein
MRFVLYEGDCGDPRKQTVRMVDGESLDAVRVSYAGAVGVAVYTEPLHGDAPDEATLRRGMPVWSW